MKIFLATPIAGFESETQMVEYKNSLSPFFDSIRKAHILYAEIENINQVSDYDSPSYSVQHDFGLIDEFDVFILHYPKKMATSALIELGYAIAKQKRVIIIVDKQDTLPYLGQGLEAACDNVSIILFENLNMKCAQKILSILNN